MAVGTVGPEQDADRWSGPSRWPERSMLPQFLSESTPKSGTGRLPSTIASGCDGGLLVYEVGQAPL